MATTNDVTGDALVSKPATEKYTDNYERIFDKSYTKKPSKNKPGETIVPPSRYTVRKDKQ